MTIQGDKGYKQGQHRVSGTLGWGGEWCLKETRWTSREYTVGKGRSSGARGDVEIHQSESGQSGKVRWDQMKSSVLL